MNKMIPLPLMGDGMGRLLRIALAITDATKGIVLIDEIENGLHYTVMKNVWKAIAQLARKYSTQLFVTTHSRECIQAAHEAFTEEKTYDFLLHRLDRIKGKISDVVYDKEALEAALKAKFEIR
jgi:AAA15 family ATPase/GTPase